ncbi:twin-arginine translocase TatA/TatE family subunit [Demequina subtropica]|uniref:twin-arginine translocase TatA/TatE family subunit n=1 Tax=Demequina subtropica TaxID=1638989 RepID=UPI000782ABBA|nr:twin-arginine translocase TatA/TatE family subunit [Demequina subtropica]
MPGRNELIIVLVIILLLFGAPKLPQLARSLGQSMKILKDETKGLRDDEKADAPADGTKETPSEKPANSSSDEPRDAEK